jgi:hypothetical protein
MMLPQKICALPRLNSPKDLRQSDDIFLQLVLMIEDVNYAKYVTKKYCNNIFCSAPPPIFLAVLNTLILLI